VTALAVGTAASLGCAGAPDPEVAAVPQTRTLTVNDAHVGSLSGVQVRVAPASHTSRYQNEVAYRPAQIEIRNESGRPLRVRYDAFALAPAGGERTGPVPVLLMDASGGDIPGMGGLSGEAWKHRNFEIASAYAERYPDIEAYEGAFEATTLDAYRAAGPGGVEPSGLRDRQLLANTIPEGVLMSGGHVSGILWFESIDQADTSVVFTMDLVDASTGEQFGTIDVPFDLTRSRLEPGTETWDPDMANAAEPVDVMVVLNASDPASYESRRVQLQSARVQKVVSDRVFWVGPDGGQWLLVTHGDPTVVGPISATPVQEGQTVTLIGTLRRPPGAAEARASWRLDQTGADMLSRSRLYLVADDVRAY
jgi:hypothetical protein